MQIPQGYIVHLFILHKTGNVKNVLLYLGIYKHNHKYIKMYSTKGFLNTKFKLLTMH